MKNHEVRITMIINKTDIPKLYNLLEQLNTPIQEDQPIGKNDRIKKHRLSFSKAADIREMYEKGTTIGELIDTYGCDAKSIRSVLQNRTWVK